MEIYSFNFKDTQKILASEKVTQWDTGLSIRAYGLGTQSAMYAHFSNIARKTAYVVKGTMASGSTSSTGTIFTFNIPAAILQEPHDVFVYFVINGVTEAIGKFELVKRAKPDDYVYKESDDYLAISDVYTEIAELRDLFNASDSSALETRVTEAEADIEELREAIDNIDTSGGGTGTGTSGLTQAQVDARIAAKLEELDLLVL